MTTHPSFKPIVDLRARLYDMAHEAKHRDAMSYIDPASNEPCNLALKLPKTQQDWHDKRRYVDAQLNEIGGVVVRVGDEKLGRRHRERGLLGLRRSARAAGLHQSAKPPRPGGCGERRLLRQPALRRAAGALGAVRGPRRGRQPLRRLVAAA